MIEGAGGAAAADERMFSRWHATRQAQQAAPAALVNQASWMVDDFEIPGDVQLLQLDAHVAEVSRPAAAAGIAVVALAHASQLLDRCTVLSSKKQVEPCCICLDDIAVNALVPLLYCGHRMHRECLLKWLTQRLSEQPALQLEQAVVCPMCKQVSVDRRLLCSVDPV
jgi:hypothetical protein